MRNELFVQNLSSLSLYFSLEKSGLNPTPSAWPLHANTALIPILWEILFLDQLHDFSLLSLNSFLNSFLKSNFMKKSVTPNLEQNWFDSIRYFFSGENGQKCLILFSYDLFLGLKVKNFHNFDESSQSKFWIFCVRLQNV